MTATPQGLDVKGSTFSVYQAGTAWTNYVVNFDVKVVSNETGWMVYGVPLFGFRFTLAVQSMYWGYVRSNLVTKLG
jgi:alpha-L-rhamnosidase